MNLPGSLTWELVPLYYCPEGEACVVFVCSQLAVLVFSSSSAALQILFFINGNKVILYLIESRESGIHSSLFKGLPVQTPKHVRYTGCVMVTSSHPPCRSPLNHLDLMC